LKAKEGEKTKEEVRLESILAALAESQLRQTEKSRSEGLVHFLDNLHPLIKFMTPFFAAFIWFQSNFATMQMYKEQEQKIIETNIKLDNQYKEVKALIDQRHSESVVHSNNNRDRMMSLMFEIKDSLKTLFLDRQVRATLHN
jgi:hypothetical protein